MAEPPKKLLSRSACLCCAFRDRFCDYQVGQSNISIGPLFQFWSIQRVTTTKQFTDTAFPCTVAMCVQLYEEQCGILLRDFVVNRCKALLGSPLLWPLNQTYYFYKVQIEAGFWFVTLTKMVPFMVSVVFARFFHFKTTFWINHWCENFDCRCK